MRLLLSLLLMLCVELGHAQIQIPLTDYAGHPKLKQVAVKINGVSYNFLFDTGAGVTIISPQLAKRIFKEPYGRGVGYRMLGEKVEYQKCDSVQIQIGAYAFQHSTVGVWDVNKVLPAEWPRIDGVLSLGSFQGTCLSLDLANNSIMVESYNSCFQKSATMEKVGSQFTNGLFGLESSIFVKLDKNDRNWWFLMDSGNLDKNKLAHSTAKAWNLHVQSDSGRVDVADVSYEISGISKTGPSVVDEIIYDGVLNFDFLSEFVIMMSFEEEKVWFKQKN